MSLLHSLLRGGVHRRHPLSEQRDRLAILHSAEIDVESFLDELDDFLLDSGAEQFSHDVPARVLRNELDEMRELRQDVLDEDLEQTTLAETFTNVTRIEHPLDSEFRGFCESLQEVRQDSALIRSAVRRYLVVHIQEGVARGFITDTTVLGESLVLLEDLFHFGIE